MLSTIADRFVMSWTSSVFLGLALALAATTAMAGAWSREKGQTFIAVGGNFFLLDGTTRPVYYDPTAYVEHGLTDKITVGMDFYMADQNQIAAMMGFVRFPIGSTEGRHRLALSFGLGARYDEVSGNGVLARDGVHWGMGLENGWLSVDASATTNTRDLIARPKLDLTWGRHWTDRWTSTLQLQTGQGFTGDYYAKINPNVVYVATQDLDISFGMVKALTGDQGLALKLETWWTF